MKTILLLLFIAVFSLKPMAVLAGEINSGGSAQVAFYSSYVWRGQTLSESFVIEPTTGFAYGNFSANLWSNYDSDTGELNETDLTINYAVSLGDMGLDIGYIYYGLDGVDDTQELYAGISSDLVLDTSLTLYYDMDAGEGGFIDISIGQSVGLIDDISVDLSLSVGINLSNKVMGANAAGEEFTGIYNANLSIATSVPLTGNITLDPSIAYSIPLSDDAEAAIKAASVDGKTDIFYGAIAVSLSF